MSILKKTIALAIIATFLASIPLVFADSNAGLVRIVYELKVNANYAKPPGTPGAKVEPSYVLIAKGLSSTPVDIYYQPDYAVDPGFVTAIQSSVLEYESEANKDLFGNLISETGLAADTAAPDGKNELLFGDLGSTSTIAVTYAWITRGRTKLIVEFDVVFNTYFNWGDAGATSETDLQNTAVMDTLNIVTHEMGHCVGLGDLYQSQNAKQTMFGYAYEGETWKRTLESGDIAGLIALYSS